MEDQPITGHRPAGSNRLVRVKGGGGSPERRFEFPAWFEVNVELPTPTGNHPDRTIAKPCVPREGRSRENGSGRPYLYIRSTAEKPLQGRVTR
jgi:hypothetical protein